LRIFFAHSAVMIFLALRIIAAIAAYNLVQS
jgi:hypothetical protein